MSARRCGEVLLWWVGGGGLPKPVKRRSVPRTKGASDAMLFMLAGHTKYPDGANVGMRVTLAPRGMAKRDVADGCAGGCEDKAMTMWHCSSTSSCVHQYNLVVPASSFR